MSWLYRLSKRKDSCGKIFKTEGEIRAFTDRSFGFGNYTDYYFCSNTGETTHLTTWNPPTDGYVRNRSVFLEAEDDDRAKSLLIADIQKDIRKLEQRIENLNLFIEEIHETEVEENDDRKIS